MNINQLLNTISETSTPEGDRPMGHSTDALGLAGLTGHQLQGRESPNKCCPTDCQDIFFLIPETARGTQRFSALNLKSWTWIWTEPAGFLKENPSA